MTADHRVHGDRPQQQVFPLEPTREQIIAMMTSMTDFVTGFVNGGKPVQPSGVDLLAPPPDTPGDFDSLLRTVSAATGSADDTTGPGCFTYFTGGGLLVSALAELLGRVTNRYTAFASMAEQLVAMEHGVLRWLCGEFGLPDTAGGVLTTGASNGIQSALLAARTLLLGPGPNTGTIYVTEHTHHSVAKAALMAGLAPQELRVVPVTEELRMDPRGLESLVTTDRAAGRRPFLIVGTAGSTDTGTIDPLPELADVARRQRVWFHVDAAYGGGFQLTERGRAKLAGVEQADSITLDAHKSLFLPYTTGVLLIRDLRILQHAYAGPTGNYLQDLDLTIDLPNYADLGSELSRENRGLRLWLPLHLHGVGAFRAALDEKLDLSGLVHRQLRDIPAVRTLRPDLTVHVFRVHGAEEQNRELLELINATGRVSLTSTRLHDQNWLRMCVLNHRTHREHVMEALDIIRWAVPRVRSGHERTLRTG